MNFNNKEFHQLICKLKKNILHFRFNSLLLEKFIRIIAGSLMLLISTCIAEITFPFLHYHSLHMVIITSTLFDPQSLALTAIASS
jgi:hypothetical protein